MRLKKVKRDREKMEPRKTVYKNLKTGVYYVQPYAMGPVAATWFGDPTVVRPEEFRAKIADAVIANLERFGQEKYEPEHAIRLSPKEQKQFLDDYIEVSVGKPATGGLVSIHSVVIEVGELVMTRTQLFFQKLICRISFLMRLPRHLAEPTEWYSGHVV